MKITHRPSGSMCQVCRFRYQPKYTEGHCPKPDRFKAMKQIKTDKDGVIVVKCERFERESKAL